MSNIMGDFFQIFSNFFSECLNFSEKMLISTRCISMCFHVQLDQKKSWKDSIAYAFCLQGFCGNYGATGKGVEFDHLQIPRASTNAIPTGLQVGTVAAGIVTNAVNDNFCGGCLAAIHSMPYLAGTPAAAIAANVATICSRVTPFLVRFVTDVGEGPLETVQSGFNLQYLLT